MPKSGDDKVGEDEIWADPPRKQQIEPDGATNTGSLSPDIAFNALAQPSTADYAIDLGFKPTPSPRRHTGFLGKVMSVLGIKPAAYKTERLTPLGHMKVHQLPFQRRRLLEDLYSGAEDIKDYAKSVCYDAVAYCWALDGKISRSTLLATTGTNWLPIFDFEKGTRWTGGPIPKGSAVGFRYADPEYENTGDFFHCTIATDEGTVVRGVNSTTTTTVWKVDFDLTELHNEETGNYELDEKPIELWYVERPSRR